MVGRDAKQQLGKTAGKALGARPTKRLPVKPEIKDENGVGGSVGAAKDAKRRSRSGVAAVRMGRRLRRTKTQVTQFMPFVKMIRDICEEQGAKISFRREAMKIFHAAMEQYFLEVLMVSKTNTAHRKRSTLNHHDINLTFVHRNMPTIGIKPE